MTDFETAKEKIKTFAQKILFSDLAENLLSIQQQQWGNFLRNPLPVDSASDPSPILFTQLLKTMGNAAERFNEALDEISANSQDRAIICAAAASGMGKTHLAYAVGRKHFLILIRVMSNCGNCNGDELSNKSPAWDLALQYMLEIKAQLSGEDNVLLRTKSMLRIVHILLYAYIEFTILALQSVTIPDLNRQKEFVLRLHRNGVADELIKQLLEHNVKQLRNGTGKLICEESFCAYRNQLLQSLRGMIPPTEKLIFCVDEINGLAKDFLYDFVRQNAIENAENLLEGEHPESRGLMYALFCVLKKLCSVSSSLYCYVTGTALSVAKFQSEIDGISVARGSMLPVSPDTLLSVEDMICILNHYFVWDDAALDMLRRKLAGFEGRPQFFARGVFEPLITKLPKSSDAHQLTAAMFCNFELMVHSRALLVTQYANKYLTMFGPEARSIPSGMKNLRVFLPIVICAHLSDGVYCVPTKEILEGAVYTGILPMGVNVQDGAWYEMDLKREPIIRDSIAKLVRQKIASENGVQRLLSLMTDIGDEKGKLAELIFCMFIVLQVEKMCLQSEVLDLLSLFKVLTESNHHQYLNLEFEDYGVHCKKIIDMKTQNNRDHQSFLRALVRPEANRYDFESILLNIDNRAGVDIAFMVKPLEGSGEDLRPRLVVIQSKNSSSETLDDSLMTLSPGCQYLTNVERKRFLEAFYNGSVNIKLPRNNATAVGYGKAIQRDHVSVCTEHPVLASNWIRVCLVARPVSEQLVKLINDLRDGNNVSVWSKLIRGDGKIEKIVQSLWNSPLVVLSMQAHSFLLQIGRDRLIGDVTSVLMKPRQYRRWVAITTSDVENLLH